MVVSGLELVTLCETSEWNTQGAFHSTKFSGLKFRVFHATNGTVFSGSKFGAKTEDSFTFVYLLSGCSIDDAEVKINDVLGKGDNTTYNLSYEFKTSPRLHLWYDTFLFPDEFKRPC